MKEFITAVTRGGQVTVPAEVGRVLGVGPHDKVAFVMNGNEVRLVPVKYGLESLAGSVLPATNTEDLEERIEEAKEEMAAKQAALLRQK